MLNGVFDWWTARFGQGAKFREAQEVTGGVTNFVARLPDINRNDVLGVIST